VRILIWHVHGSWTTAFVQGGHDYVLPVTTDRGPDGRGRAATWDWPHNAVEVPPEQLRHTDLDVVVLQRPHELELVRRWTGRRAGRDLPAVYLEHNTPGGDVPFSRHPLADQSEIPVVHVTPFNRLMWDCGNAPTAVVEHGIVDPGHRYTGELGRAAVVVNDPVRRGRAVGTDLLERMAGAVPLDVFGIAVSQLAGTLDVPAGRFATYEGLSQARLHTELSRRRLYLHTSRWTSLGLSLLEAMMLGMPVLALATTEAVSTVDPSAGRVSTSVDVLLEEARRLVQDPDRARRMGDAARESALQRHGLKQFLDRWDVVLGDAVARHGR
jgi:glycosyltransferase involved in cell wall biosynthesis